MGKAECDLAVAENRMVTRQEGTVRRVVGAGLFIFVLWNLHSKGVANVSPASTAFWVAMALTVFGTGVRHQCGCAVRLRWAVDSPNMERVPAPPQYLVFMCGKRREFLANVTGSALAAAAGTAVLYCYCAAHLQAQWVLKQTVKGAAVEAASMLAFAAVA